MTETAASLADWLETISEIHPVKWDLGLERVRSVAERMDLLKPADTVVLVAGTNGKGSTCEYLSHLLRSKGQSVGKSTSPHFLSFNERIEINGELATDDEIISAFEAIEEARGEITITYFEFATLASLYIFRQHDVDVAILEIGLGGRLDAMNIVEPTVSVITSITLDHQEWLGDTREEIALEKAGIMRCGVKCIVSDRDPPVTLFEHAGTIGAPLDLIGDDFDVPRDLPRMKLPADSFAAALSAAESLGFSYSHAALSQIAQSVSLCGRWQWIEGSPPMLLDVAHNPAAAESFAGYVKEHQPDGDIHAVTGIYADKDISGVIAPFLPLVKTWHLTDLDDPRAACAENLKQLFHRKTKGEVESYAKISTAVETLQTRAEAEDLILVFGSFPVVAGALQLLQSP